MARRKAEDQDPRLTPLKLPLRLTWAGLLAERLVTSLWPLASVTMVVLAALMLGLHERLPLELVWMTAVIAVLGLGATLYLALRQFRIPTRTEALSRLDETLPGRPIGAVQDIQASGTQDAASAALWKAHQERMAERLREARAVPANIETRPRDR